MKRFSIRTTITLWFSVALILVVSITYFMVLFVGDQVIQKTIRDNLIETVEHNVDEIEFYKRVDSAALAQSLDHYVKWDGGYLEVDDDFLDEINQVYTSLCKADGSLVYGENPIAKETATVGFRNSSVQQIEADGTTYYIFDRKLTQEGLEGLWLRGVVSEVQGSIQLNSIARTSLILLPFIVLVAIVGGIFPTRRHKSDKAATLKSALISAKAKMNCTDWRSSLTRCSGGWTTRFRPNGSLLRTLPMNCARP